VASRDLTGMGFPGRTDAMSSPTEQNFQDYKRAEKKALELLAEMKAATPKKVDIELALLVAIFELHKGTVPAATVASIINGHLKQVVPFYATKDKAAN
jgi:response regulator RpfG family c-di-GMP phosphodiesterase